MKQYISYEQAISILPDGDYIHTFYNAPFGLIGADWNRDDILDKLRNSDIIELTGEQAKTMEHGMCCYQKTAKFQSEILFVETDMKKLELLENSLVDK